MRSATNVADAAPVASHFWLIILLLIVAGFHILTVRQGHIWGDDFAMYVHHAKNIVEGRPYTATGYLFHPSISVSPRMYPPVFPFLPGAGDPIVWNEPAPDENRAGHFLR